MTAAEQRERFIETARKLGANESEAGHERAFGKVGLKRPKNPKRKKQGIPPVTAALRSWA